MEIIKSHHIIKGADDKPITIDVSYLDNNKAKPIVLFSHGFKDFKDYSYFNEMADYFAKEGFYFVKFNFSHNGVSQSNLNAVTDLDSFAENNFSKELFDIDKVISWISDSGVENKEKNIQKINLLGHSRGGGISILKASIDSRVSKIVSWGAPINFENKIPPEAMDYWKNTGVIYVENHRTKQQLPLNYQIAEDYFNNLDRINILQAVKKINIPFLIVHGIEDEVVNVTEAKMMKRLNARAELYLLEHTDHYFGISYPYNGPGFSDKFNEVLQKTVQFLKS